MITLSMVVVLLQKEICFGYEVFNLIESRDSSAFPNSSLGEYHLLYQSQG